MNNYKASFLFFILFVFIIFTSVQAASVTSTPYPHRTIYPISFNIAITAKDSINKSPISGVTVSVYCESNPSFDCSRYNKETDKTGLYRADFVNIDPKANINSVKITLSKSGYNDWSKTIPAVQQDYYYKFTDKSDALMVNKNPESVQTSTPLLTITPYPISTTGFDYSSQGKSSSDSLNDLLFQAIIGVIVIGGVAVGYNNIKSKIGKQTRPSESPLEIELPEESLPADTKVTSKESDPVSPPSPESRPPAEDILQKSIAVEKRALSLSFFRSQAMAIVGQAKNQYNSGAFDTARITLSTAERVIATLKQKEDQVKKWKSEGYDTSVLENLSNENIISINSVFQDYEQNYPLLKQYNDRIRDLKQDTRYDGADPEINHRISSLELKAKDPRNLPGIDEEITAIQKTMQDYRNLADERSRSARKNVKIFISAKSEDYKFAEQIYTFLTSCGYQVFFSKESLPRMGNSEYLRQIDNAIEGAKHMIVVTSKREYVESQWVSAEWASFINEKRSARKTGNLIVLLGGTMKIEDLPISLRQYETRFLNDPNTQEQILNYLM